VLILKPRGMILLVCCKEIKEAGFCANGARACAHTHTHRGGPDGNFSLHFYKCVCYFATNYRLLVIEKTQWYAATETKTYAIYNMYIIHT